MNWPVDVTDYVLGELSPEMRVVADALMQDDASFRAEADRLRPLVQGLEALPPQAWDPPLPPAAPVPRGRRLGRMWPERLVIRPAMAIGASLALIAAGVGIGVLARDGGGAGSDGPRFALSPLAGGAPGGRAVATMTTNGMRVDVSGIPPTQSGQFYELWLLNSPTDLVGIASFRVSAAGEATITLPLPDRPERYEFLDISIEPTDGNPAHSGRSV